MTLLEKQAFEVYKFRKGYVSWILDSRPSGEGRYKRHHGGVAVLVDKRLRAHMLDKHECVEGEYLAVDMDSLLVISFYRNPNVKDMGVLLQQLMQTMSANHRH